MNANCFLRNMVLLSASPVLALGTYQGRSQRGDVQTVRLPYSVRAGECCTNYWLEMEDKSFGHIACSSECDTRLQEAQETKKERRKTKSGRHTGTGKESNITQRCSVSVREFVRQKGEINPKIAQGLTTEYQEVAYSLQLLCEVSL